MSEQETHDEQQAVLRSLNDFEATLWPAFKKRGFASMGEAFTAFLLMQLVSAKGEELVTVPALNIRIAKPLTPEAKLARAAGMDGAAIGDPVPVGKVTVSG